MASPPPSVERLLRRAGPLRSKELVQAGLSRTRISRLVAAGRLTRLGRGLYASAAHQPRENEALVTVAKRAPRVVFCLLTALRFHELTTQAPHDVWIAIGNKAHPPRLDYPPLRAVRYSDESLAAGVEEHKADGVVIRVTSVAKTVADCFKFRSKVGLDVALEALRDARRSRRVSMDELWRCALTNRVANVMRPYLEAVA